MIQETDRKVIIEEKQRHFDEVATEYYDEIFTYIKRRVRVIEDAYDLTQDVFLDYTHSYDKIDPAKTRKWLYRVAHNKVVDHYKAAKKENDHREYGDLPEYQAEITVNFEDRLTEQEEIAYKNDVISSLSDEDRQLYVDVCVHKKKVRDLYHEYGVSEAALHKRVTRMKHKIRQMIKAVLYLIFS